MASVLIEYNCTVNQMCVKRWSAMHEAAKQGRHDIVALLLKNGGNVNQRDGFGVTPLGVAAEYGHCEVLEHLIHKGALAALQVNRLHLSMRRHNAHTSRKCIEKGGGRRSVPSFTSSPLCYMS